MSRTLAVIMLDFFVMVSITFFILQFVQAEGAAPVQSRPSLNIIRVTISAAKFYELHKLTSAPLSSLLEVSFSVLSGGRTINPGRITTVRLQDGYDLIVANGEKLISPILRLYASRVNSFEYVATRPEVQVTSEGPQLEASHTTSALTFIDGPTMDIVLR